jgi:hypothetical protein
MHEPSRDPSLDALLNLDGQVLVIDPAGITGYDSALSGSLQRLKSRTGSIMR